MRRCAKCGQDNDRHFKFCLGCGGALADLPSAPAGEPGGGPPQEDARRYLAGAVGR